MSPPTPPSTPRPESPPWWTGSALALLGLVPRRARWGLVRLILALSGRRRQRLAVARTNLDLAFGDTLSNAEKTRIADASFVNLAGCMLDAAATIPRLTRDNWSRHVRVPPEDIEAVRKITSSGQGVLVMFSHYGNWELMGAAMAYMDVGAIHVVAKRQAGWGNAVIERLRAWTGNTVIYKEGAVRAALRALKSGGIVGISIDQNFSGGIFVPFFGVPAGTPDTLAALARASGAPIVPLVCVPNADGSYTGRLLPALHADRTADKAADLAATTARCFAVLEDIIRDRPELWLWGHKRWKSRPPDEEPRRDPYGATEAAPRAASVL